MRFEKKDEDRGMNERVRRGAESEGVGGREDESGKKKIMLNIFKMNCGCWRGKNVIDKETKKKDEEKKSA